MSELIDPSVSALSTLLKAGKLTEEEFHKRLPARWLALPSGLRPFLESLDLSDLGNALTEQPQLYWHPIVQRQMSHMLAQCCDENGDPKEPEEIEWIYAEILKLIGAHAVGLVPGTKIRRSGERGQPGPLPRIRNPYPAWWFGELDWIDAAILDEDERKLRELLSDRRNELRQMATESKDKAKARLTSLAQEVLEESEAAEWSGWREDTVPDPYPAPTTGTLLDIFNEPAPGPGPFKSLQLRLDSHLEKLLPPHRLTGWREGRPAYVAYAILGVLLQVSPSKIRNTLDNFRHRRRRKS